MARGRRGLDPTIVTKLDDFGYLDVNPRTGQIAFTHSRKNRFYLRSVNPDTGARRVLVTSDQSVAYPTFSEDGRLIAYASDFDGNENHDIFVLPARGGKAARITDHPADDFHPRFSPDGRTIAFISNRKADVENIFLTDLRGKAPRQLTALEDHVWRLAWHPDGRSIVFKAGEVRTSIGLVDVARRKVRRLMESPDPELNISADPWSPDGLTLAFTSAEEDHIDIGLLQVANGRTSWLVRDDRDKEEPVISADGKRVAYTALKDGDQVIAVRDVKGGKEAVASSGEGVARDPTWLPDGRIAFFHSTAARPEGLHIAGMRSRVLVPNNVPRAPASVEAKHIRYRSFDGRKIPALLFVPRRRNGAGVVHPHGGPEAARTNYWGTPDQLLASRGYVVISPNYRGSTGYGRRFRKLSDRDLGGGDMRDVNEAARHIVREGLAEPGQVGIWGVSYGGYLALHCPTQEPDLWAAAVPVVGFFDWATCYEGTRNYLRSYDIQKVGDVRKEPEFFAPRSPANFIHRLKAPVLLFAGANDPRCPAHESRRVAERIHAMGIPCEYREYTDEGHYPRRASNEVDLLRRSLDFLGEHLTSTPTKATAGDQGLVARGRTRRSPRLA